MKALENLSDRITVYYNNQPSYDIVYSESFDGIIDELKNMNIQNRRLCIVTESNVGPIYAQELKNILEPHCKKVIIHQFHAGEEYKNIDTISKIYETLIENKFDRKDMLLALGGGVTGDMTGFTALTYLRGIDLFKSQQLCLLRLTPVLAEKPVLILKLIKIWLAHFTCQNWYI